MNDIITLAYEDGVNDAIYDILNGIYRRYKYIDEMIVLSKLYDYSYILGYKRVHSFINSLLTN